MPTFPLISKTNTPDIDIFEFLQVTITLNTQKLASTIKVLSNVNNLFSRNRFPASPEDITVARVDGEVANKTKGEGYVKLRLVPLIQLLNLKAFEQQMLLKICYFANKNIFQ